MNSEDPSKVVDYILPNSFAVADIDAFAYEVDDEYMYFYMPESYFGMCDNNDVITVIDCQICFTVICVGDSYWYLIPKLYNDVGYTNNIALHTATTKITVSEGDPTKAMNTLAIGDEYRCLDEEEPTPETECCCDDNKLLVCMACAIVAYEIYRSQSKNDQDRRPIGMSIGAIIPLIMVLNSTSSDTICPQTYTIVLLIVGYILMRESDTDSNTTRNIYKPRDKNAIII